MRIACVAVLCSDWEAAVFVHAPSSDIGCRIAVQCLIRGLYLFHHLSCILVAACDLLHCALSSCLVLLKVQQHVSYCYVWCAPLGACVCVLDYCIRLLTSSIAKGDGVSFHICCTMMVSFHLWLYFDSLVVGLRSFEFSIGGITI